MRLDDRAWPKKGVSRKGCKTGGIATFCGSSTLANSSLKVLGTFVSLVELLGSQSEHLRQQPYPICSSYVSPRGEIHRVKYSRKFHEIFHAVFLFLEISSEPKPKPTSPCRSTKHSAITGRVGTERMDLFLCLYALVVFAKKHP